LATVATTWLVARNYGRGDGQGWHPELAAIAVAIDPLLLVQSSQIMTETLATFLATGALFCLLQLEQRQSRAWGIASGLTLGCAALCRPTFLPWCVFVLLLHARKTLRTRTAASFLCLALGMAFALFPWALRNYWTLGRWIVSTTHGGYTLLLGNNPEYYAHLRDVNRERVWTAEPAHEAVNAILAQENLNLVRDEITLDARLAERAKQHMRNDIQGLSLACIDRIQQLWSPLIRAVAGEAPHRSLVRYVICACYLGVYAAAIVGALRGWNSSQRPLILFAFALAISFTAVHTFYWSNLRMRSPLMPAIYLLAAGSIVRTRGSMSD
jgi:4-amino-4-deoxy-L-arabinose transferase-like glycosyltransferase